MSAQRLARIPRHILVGAVAALATAAIHLSVVTFSREVLGNFSWAWYSRDVVWMVPLGYLTVYAFISIPLGILAALLPKGLSTRTTAWLWVTMVAFASLLLYRRVNSWALLILALAVGYQFSQFAARRPETMRRVVTRAGIALAGAFALIIATFEGGSAMSARRAIAAQPTADSTAPNVLLIVWDTARAKSLSLYGYNRATTPFLDSLARHAIVFDRAFVTAPWTLPSHASMLTGQYATAQSGDWASPMDRTHRTLAEDLRDHGYATGAFVANWLATGYATGLHRGFVRYEDTQRSFGEVMLNTTLTQSTVVQKTYAMLTVARWYGEAVRTLVRFNWRPASAYQEHAWKSAAQVTDGFLRWQGSTKAPFFAFLNYGEAHDPHRAPARDRFNGGATLEDRYDGALWSLDREVQRLVAELERRGQLARTIIVLTSDHGEQFNDNGLNGHGNSLYLTLLHVPLVIYAPQHPAAGDRVAHVVSLRDLPRTLLDLAGISDTSLPGTALLPRDSASLARLTPSPAISEVSSGIRDQPKNPTYYGDLKSVVGDSLHVIRDGKGEYQVFAYRRDSAEVTNLARDRQVAHWARSHIDSLVQAFGLRPPNARTRRAGGR